MKNIAGKTDRDIERALLSMKLHEIKAFDKFHLVVRVPGGWIYETFAVNSNDEMIGVSSVFVGFAQVGQF